MVGVCPLMTFPVRRSPPQAGQMTPESFGSPAEDIARFTGGLNLSTKALLYSRRTLKDVNLHLV